MLVVGDERRDGRAIHGDEVVGEAPRLGVRTYEPRKEGRKEGSGQIDPFIRVRSSCVTRKSQMSPTKDNKAHKQTNANANE